MRFDVVVRSRVRGHDHVAENVFASRLRPGSVENVLREAAGDSWAHVSRGGRHPVRWLDLRHRDDHGNVVGSVWFWCERRAVVVAAVPRKPVDGSRSAVVPSGRRGDESPAEGAK